MKKLFRSRGPQFDTFNGLFGGAAIMLTGGVGIVAGDLSVLSFVFVLLAMSLGGMCFVAGLYSLRGRLEVERTETGWTVTRGLWRWSSKQCFPRQSIHHIERFLSPPDLVATRSGHYLLVYLVGRTRPIPVGGGLRLTESDLQEIEDLLAPELDWPVPG